MNSADIINKEKQYLMDTYTRYPVVIVRGRGATVYDCEGKEYIDFSSGVGVNSLGYGNYKWARAVSEQAKKLAHISNLFYNPVMVELAEILVNITGMSKVFFANSGAEANEGAIKLARKYSFDKYGKGRSNIITLENSFHGRTITTLAATGQEQFHNFFFPFTEGFKFAKANDIGSVINAADKSVCAIMIEMIQGEGGVLPLDKDFVLDASKLAKEKDILLIVDEVQTGVGRTGTFLACQQYGIKPDIVTLAKGLGGGLPIGAVLCSEPLSSVLGKGTHASTFGANPVCCAGAIEVLKQIGKKDFLDEVTKKGEYIRNKLSELPQVTEIRGKGLLLGVDLKGFNSKEITKKMVENGLLIITAKSAVRIMPPLVISYEEIDKGLEIFKNTINS